MMFNLIFSDSAIFQGFINIFKRIRALRIRWNSFRIKGFLEGGRTPQREKNLSNREAYEKLSKQGNVYWNLDSCRVCISIYVFNYFPSLDFSWYFFYFLINHFLINRESFPDFISVFFFFLNLTFKSLLTFLIIFWFLVWSKDSSGF